jgi:putative tricarboxylic transport membrane protein
MKLKVNKAILALAVFGLAAAVGVSAGGSNEVAVGGNAYPVKTVTLITHSSPGGGSDLFLREMIKFLGPQMNVDFVVKNVKGGGGAPAMAELAKSPADGSVFYATTPTCIQTPMFAKTEYTIDDLEPMVNVFLDPMVVYTRKASPLKDLKDVVRYAKENPGKAKWGSGTAAELGRQILEQLKDVSGTDVRIVSFEGGGDLMLSVLNGTLDIGAGEVAEISSQLDAGQVRILAFFTDQRLVKYPDVPTAVEQGINMSLSKFRGLTGPKGLPANVVRAWEDAIPKLLANPEYKKLYSENCLQPAFMDQKTFQAYVAKTETELRGYLVKMGVIK